LLYGNGHSIDLRQGQAPILEISEDPGEYRAMAATKAPSLTTPASASCPPRHFLNFDPEDY
jgi:hypothetical protein